MTSDVSPLEMLIRYKAPDDVCSRKVTVTKTIASTIRLMTEANYGTQPQLTTRAKEPVESMLMPIGQKPTARVAPLAATDAVPSGRLMRLT
jgi:hypothetical protein